MMISGQKINGTKAQKLMTKGAILIDVRDGLSFRDHSIPNSINLPLRRISEVLKYPKTTSFIIVGFGHEDSDVKAAINYIGQYGFPIAYSLGDVDNWNK